MAEEKEVLQQEEVEEEPKKQKDLKKHKVKSSNLDWVAYDEEEETLYVQFLNGSLYNYEKVPKDVFEGLLNAGSHGRYFYAKVRNKNYKYNKLKGATKQ